MLALPDAANTLAQMPLRPGFAYTPVASVSQLISSGPPEPARGAEVVSGTKSSSIAPLGIGR